MVVFGCNLDSILCVSVERRETVFTFQMPTITGVPGSTFSMRERNDHRPTVHYFVYLEIERDDSLLTSHLHDGKDGTLLLVLTGRIETTMTDSAVTRLWTVQRDGQYNGELPFDDFYRRMTGGPVYLDAHTRHAPSGELRGTLHLSAPSVWEETRSCSS